MSKQPRPKELIGITYEARSCCGKLYVVCNDRDGRLFEIFVRLGKSGTCGSSMMNAVAVQVSGRLRSGSAADQIVKELKGINCHRSTVLERSCIDAVASAIEEHKANREVDYAEAG